MKKVTTIAFAVVLSILTEIPSITPASAGPIQVLVQPEMQNSELLQAQYRPPNRRPHSNNRRPESRRHRSNRHDTWHGYRGSRYRRPGYRRRSNGWWYPAAAFTAGALIGSAAASRPVYHVAPSSRDRHVSWCMNRFRSYRVSDNTFQPYSGARRQCVSPYSVR